MQKRQILGLSCMLLLALTGCYKPGPGAKPWRVSGLDGAVDVWELTATNTPILTAQEPRVVQVTTPTPNPPITLPTPRREAVEYVVQYGDSLRKIAQIYQVSIDQISQENQITNPNLIEVGQVLRIPPPNFWEVAPPFKIIPDSELVYSPSNAAFDLQGFVERLDGFLVVYSEVVDEEELTGVEVIRRIATEYSINPRLLLTVLEYQSSWVSKRNPLEETLTFPLKYFDASKQGLYQQLAWASNLLNEGYYLWNINAIHAWTLVDSTVIQVDPTINPGTAGVLNLMRTLNSQSEWETSISAEGIYLTYTRLFGYPFDMTFEPLIPENLTQPELQLPFELGDVWSYTGGPHGGWDTGSAWAAIDFAPPGDSLGCFPSSAWVVASAAGEIVYSDNGAVIQDLESDGVWQKGWSILYMHIDPRERVPEGTFLEVGEKIGHPSCEGGFSTGTHLHLARRYNGEWVAADGNLPLILDGWVSVGYGVEYNGYLIKGDLRLEAWNGRSSINAIKR